MVTLCSEGRWSRAKAQRRKVFLYTWFFFDPWTAVHDLKDFICLRVSSAPEIPVSEARQCVCPTVVRHWRSLADWHRHGFMGCDLSQWVRASLHGVSAVVGGVGDKVGT